MQPTTLTRLSSKGQIIIPKTIRHAHGWDNGQEFIVEETVEGILLRPYKPTTFHKTTLAQVAGCLKPLYKGKAKTLDEMNAAVRKGLKASWT